jgi:hypothetical protein
MLVIGLATIMIIILTFPGYTQDTLKKNPKTTLKLKIIKDENGKRTIIDTTITSNKSLDSGEVDEIIATLDDNMKGLDEGLKDLDISLSKMKFPDSTMMDSIHKMTDRLRTMMSKNFKSPHSRWHTQPGAFDYNFDFDTPEPPEPPEPRGERHHHYDFRVEPFNMEPPSMRRNEGSLMDLLRNIPMDRIKSFTIKEKKDGTRITIEVGRGSVFGKPHSSERTIIVRPERGNAPGSHHESGRHKRVIIKSDSEDPDEL